MRLARVVVDKAAVRYDKIYTYEVPTRLEDTLRPGCRVMVPFGKASRARLALVLEVLSGEPDGAVKAITSLEDSRPVIGEDGIRLMHYLKSRTYCRYFEALSALIPPGVGLVVERVAELIRPLPSPLPELDEAAAAVLCYLSRRRGAASIADISAKSGADEADEAIARLEALGLCLIRDKSRRKTSDKTEAWVCLTGGEAEGALSPKQQSVIDLLTREGELPLGETMELSGVGRSVVARLEAAGLVEVFRRTWLPCEPVPSAANADMPVLSQSQRRAADSLIEMYEAKEARTALLYGVTGSGKTAVYLHLIKKVVESGRSVIVLVPEISLTPQAVEMFFAHFGPDAAVIHSSLSATERSLAHARIRDGGVKIVIGTRSAVFAPLKDIGLIIIDEEQEHTYHSESAPRYHAGDVAAFRCRGHSAMLLLASATPRVETYEAARSGRIGLVELTERYAGATLPEVRVIDLRSAALAGNSTSITEELSAELAYNLDKKEQSILLLNRRGYNTLVKCSSCGESVKCPYCEVAMTYHAVGGKLLCHYCGFTRPAGGVCPLCASELTRYTGVGTQRVEEELLALFPAARVLRMDADTTGSRYAHREAFSDFAKGKYDIMVGTQMVAKGLNFPKVTLVGVLLADQSFYCDDFRSCERSFSLITQVVGRCGRGELPGRAYIQTYTPGNRILPLSQAQDYPGFFGDEIAFRKAGLYPPYCDLFLIGFSGEVQKDVSSAAMRFADTMSALAGTKYPGLPLRVLGPAPFSVPKVAGRWRWRIIVKCRRSAALHELLSTLYMDFHAERKNEGVSCYIDPYCDNL